MRSLSDRIIGRSCSTTTRVASSSCWTRLISGPNASASRWATPAVGSSRQITRGRDREHRRELHDAAGAGRELGDEAVGVAAEAEEVDELGGLRALDALGARSRAAATAVLPQNDVGGARFERELHRLAHGQLGEQRGGLERAAEAGPGAAVRGQRR